MPCGPACDLLTHILSLKETSLKQKVNVIKTRSCLQSCSLYNRWSEISGSPYRIYAQGAVWVVPEASKEDRFTTTAAPLLQPNAAHGSREKY